MKLRIELRPGEGGQDAKLLTQEMADIYSRYAASAGLRAQLTTEVG